MIGSRPLFQFPNSQLNRQNAMRSLVALLLLGGLTLTPVQAQDYVLQTSTVSGGGATSTSGSGSLTLTSSVGQTAIGTQQGNTVVLYSGYPPPFLDAAALVVRVEEELSDDVSVGEAVSLTAIVTSRLADVEDVTLYHRPGGATEFENTPMNPADGSEGQGGAYEGAIPADAVTDRGIAYYVEAVDAEGNTARNPTQGVRSFRVRVEEEGIEKDSPQPNGSTPAAYRLVSVPIDLDAKEPEEVLQDDLGAYDDGRRWRFVEGVRRDGDEFVEYPDTEAMAPGRAFWLIVRDPADPIDTGAGAVLPIDEVFEIELREGWNYIGNPFHFPVPVSNLRTESGETPRLYAWDGDWSALDGGNQTLQPFSGYALESSEEDRLYVDPVLASGASSSVRAKARAADAEAPYDWAIRIAGRSGDLRDDHNVAAVASGAAAGRDAMDWPEPPRPGDGLSVTFARPAWDGPHANYLVDVREAPARGETWPFEVRTTRRAPMTLTFDGLAQVPEAFEVWLLDEYSKASQDLRATPRYTIDAPPTDGARSFRLVVGASDYVEQALEAAGALPATYELAGVYPNPTNGASTIRYGLPKEQTVTLTVYNTLGQRVATLMRDTPREAGYHTVRWSGKTGSGAPVASGVYFVRMQAGDFTATKKIVRVN